MQYQRILYMCLLLLCNTVVASDFVRYQIIILIVALSVNQTFKTPLINLSHRLSDVTDQVKSLLYEQFSGTAYNDIQQVIPLWLRYM